LTTCYKLPTRTASMELGRGTGTWELATTYLPTRTASICPRVGGSLSLRSIVFVPPNGGEQHRFLVQLGVTSSYVLFVPIRINRIKLHSAHPDGDLGHRGGEGVNSIHRAPSRLGKWFGEWIRMGPDSVPDKGREILPLLVRIGVPTDPVPCTFTRS